MATITIIGTGLIGCSFGMALRKHGHFVIGCDNSQNNLTLAKELEAVDATSQSINLPACHGRQSGSLPTGKQGQSINQSIKQTINQSTIVILATPVDHILETLPQILDNLPNDAVVIDTGSTKMAICQSVQNHPRRNAFVAAHPMAGSEHSGPQAAKPNLFVNKRVAICESGFSSQASLSRAIALFESIGLKPIFMSSEQHDSTVALVSHLPQLMAYAFASLPEFEETASDSWLNVASSGFDSSTRLAMSQAEIWLPIIMQNKEFVIDALCSLSKSLNKMANNLINQNIGSLYSQIECTKRNRSTFEKKNRISDKIELAPLTK